MKTGWIAVALVTVILMSACGGTSRPSAATPPSPAPTAPAEKATATAVRPKAAASPTPAPLAGFGALDSDWAKGHKEDTSKVSGSGYDRQADGTDRFASVEHTSGRITGFTMQINGVAIAAAKDMVSVLLPADAKLIYDRVAGGPLANPQCEITEYQTATLGQVLGDPKIGDPQGYVEAIYSTSSNSNGTFDAQHIDTIEVGVGIGPDQLATVSC